ncbi:hypothetical protein RFI_04206 [Reticulomyxa filosa]|uniref:Methyltransferase n=1 Tax=Reticulomyxa filosa TaxID=46433 RepID=X6P5N5_RETFI|nr:hypothetical protein RFI_04206 [Reticulomyxa filosa]|eukprot:ETO32912.1 hypothetical protein RFI_04206 [Reticulomyxa filosa]
MGLYNALKAVLTWILWLLQIGLAFFFKGTVNVSGERKIEEKEKAEPKNSKKEGKPRNPSKRSIHYVLESNVKNPNEGVTYWMEQKQLVDRLLNDPAFRSMSSSRHLKKEMTESYAQLSVIKQLLSEKESFENCIIFDICCGKGYFGVLGSHCMPTAHFVLCDKNAKMNLNVLTDNQKNIYFYA